MFSDKLKSRVAGLALISAAFAIPAVASAGVVVKSTGPSSGDFPVGRQVEDTTTITLETGDRITVLTESGTRVMQGPGTFRVGEGATRTRARFSNLTRRNAARRVRTGAVRGTGEGVARSPNLWFVNVAASGTMCLYDLNAVRLWRPEASDAQTYRIVDQASQGSLDVAFVESEAVRSLDPEGMTLTSGGNYTIMTVAPEMPEADAEATAEGEAATEVAEATEQPAFEPSSVDVKFIMLTEQYSAPDQLAQALISNGCTTQLTLLADTLEASVRP